MEIEDRIKALEEEFQETKKELQHILLDIRYYLMAAQSPLRPENELDIAGRRSKTDTI